MRLLFSVVLTLLLGAAPAFAHAMLVHADPAAGQTSSSQTIVLQFSEELEPKFSSVGVFHDGHPVPGQTQFGKKTMTFTIAGPPPAPGRYEVRWRVLSVDGHVTQGAYQFIVFAAIH